MKRRTFLLLTALLSLVYLAIEVVYIRRLPLVMDEFQGARTVARLAERLPYLDYFPYKTLLGYYAQLPALMSSTSLWDGLMAVKLEMAILSATMLFAMALALARHFRRESVLSGAALLVCMSTFLERSPDLRVDMLTAIAGLTSLLLLLERRWLAAGLVCGVSFLISQKGIYYALAANGAMTILWFSGSKASRRLAPFLRFNLALTLVVAAYLGFWSILAPPSRVLAATFSSHADIALGTMFQDIRLLYWLQTLQRNPLFWLSSVLGLVSLGRRSLRKPGATVPPLLAGYGLVLFALGLWHKQPWPYFFVLLIPTAAVLATATLDEVADHWTDFGPHLRAALVGFFVLAGILFPLTRVRANLERSSAFQEQTVRLAAALLEPEESYLAGLELLWDRDQSVPGFGWIDRASMSSMRSASESEVGRLLSVLDEAPIKLVVENYRIRFLPSPLVDALDRRFQRFWGNILLYSPVIEREGEFRLDFEGRYVVESVPGASHLVDGHPVTAGETLRLSSGSHFLSGSGPVRLRWLPAQLELHLDPRFKEPRDLFPNVYGY